MKTSPTFMLDRDYSKFTLEEKISLFRELYQRLYEILNVCFSGYLMVMDEELNLKYVKICLIIEKILASEDSEVIRDLHKKYERPFESLYEHWGEGDILWDDGGLRQRTLEFKGSIEEDFVKLGEPKIADLVSSEFLSEIDEYLTIYARSKKAREIQFIKNVEKQAEKSKQTTQEKTYFTTKAKRKLGFIKD